MKIKVAVLTDIHGNSVALEAALKDAKKYNIDEFIICGDLVNDFPCSNEVIDTLKNLTPNIIKGNREQYLIEYDKHKYDWKNIQFKNTLFLYNQLTKENLEFVKKLPTTLKLKYEDITFRIVHGNMHAINGLVYIEDEEAKKECVKELDEDVVILGHTHQYAWVDRVNNKTIINAGCIGIAPKESPEAEYIILNINGKDLDVEIKKVKYSLDELKRKIVESGILEYDTAFMNLDLLTITGKADIARSFYFEAIDLMKEKNKKLYQDEAEGIFKDFRLYDDDIWQSLTKKYEKYFLI